MPVSAGESHRKVVQDANAGNIEPPQQKSVQSGGQVSSRQTHQIGQRKPNALGDALLSVAEPVLVRRAAEEKQRKFQEGYDKGTREGAKEMEEAEGVIGKFLWGKSSTLRGAQLRITQDIPEQRMTDRLVSIKDDKMKYDQKEYEAVLLADLDAELEKQDDPEVRQEMIDTFTRNSAQLARMHFSQRQVWKDGLKAQVTMDGIHNAARYTRDAVNTIGDADLVADRKRLLSQRLLRSANPDMSDEAWETHTVTAIGKELSEGHGEALEVAKENGVYDTIRGAERLRLDGMISAYDQKNSEQFHLDKQGFEDLMNGTAEAPATVASINEAVRVAEGMNTKYADTMNMNGVRGLAEQQRRRLAEEAKQRTVRANQYLSGNADTIADPAQRQEAAAAVLSKQASELIMQERDRAADMARANGEVPEYDPNPPSPEEIQAKLRDNPQIFSNLWSKNGVVNPLITTEIKSVLSAARNPSITREQSEALKDRFTKMEHLRQRNQPLFNSHMKGQDSSEYAMMANFLLNTDGHPHEAVMQWRERGQGGPYGTPEIGISDNAIDDITNEFTEAKGHEWFGVINDNPDNMEEWEGAIRESFSKHYNMYGDVDDATAAARAEVMRNGATFSSTSGLSDTWHHNGKQLNDASYNGDFQGYLRGLQSNSHARQSMLNANFPLNTDLLGPNVTYRLTNGGTHVDIQTYDADRQPHVWRVLMPQNETHMLDHGVRKAAVIADQIGTDVTTGIGKAADRGATIMKDVNQAIQTYDIGDTYNPQ